MPPGPKVRRIGVDDWSEMRALRLNALRSDPRAFGSTLARESGYPAERWREWCRRGASGPREAIFVVADGSSPWVGMGGLFPEGSRFHLWGLWVHPDHRGRGLGGSLVDALLRWIDDRFPGSEVVLDVNPDQPAAVRLYLGRGFAFTGDSQPLGHSPPAEARRMARRPATPT